MDAMASTATQPTTSSDQRVSWFNRCDGATPIVLVAVFLLAATALSRSFLDGRLSSPMTHNDVNYFIDGIRHLMLLQARGFFGLLSAFLHDTMHAPVSTYQAMLAYMIFGFNDWAPYVSNIVYAAIFLCVAAYLLRGLPNIVVTAAMACLISMPLSSNMITEFAPETVSSVFTAIGVVLMLKLPLLDAPMWPRVVAGLCFNIGYLAHPSAFAFTAIALLGTVGMTFLRDIIFSWRLEKIGSGLLRSFLNLLLSLWLAALYMGPRFGAYWDYFYTTIFNTSYTFYYPSQSRYYVLVHLLTGPGGQFMFGYQIWLYAAIIALGLAAACWRKDRPLLVEQAEMLPLIFVFWLVPSLPSTTNYLFGQTFGFTVGFLMVISVRSIYESIRGTRGAISVSVLGIVLLLLNHSHFDVPNVPVTPVNREFAFRAIGRLDADLLGNATAYHNTRVYMTNQGAYAANILQYYLLKTDPNLDWALSGIFPATGVKEHLDFIRNSRPDFVIAAQKGNGLTYQFYTWPQAENAALAALERNPDYMAIDRFYGQNGGTVTVFQRRVDFGGWRPISGIVSWAQTQDSPRLSTAKITYLRTFAARPARANLQIECSGIPREKIAISVNQQRVAELAIGTDGKASLDQQITLNTGQNDIVLQYSTADGVFFQRLLVIPHIIAEE